MKDDRSRSSAARPAVAAGAIAARPGIRRKLAAAFLLVAFALGLFVALSVHIYNATVERAALLEAEHVAELVAAASARIGLDQPRALQDYVASTNSLRKRDVVIVDLQKIGVADADPAEIGEVFDHDSGGEVGKTLADGVSRTFIEKNGQHVDGAYQLVVPVRLSAAQGAAPIMGAAILEYTAIRQALFAAERDNLLLIIVVGGLVVLAVAVFGLDVARRIARPLSDLTAAVERVALEDYAARVSVTSNDEVGMLSGAFNRMAQELSQSHAQLIEHKDLLEQRIAARTEELSSANRLLQQEVQERQLAAERIEYLAYYDSLTGLPNRSLFGKLLQRSIAAARDKGKRMAVLFVDLDRFKNINDTLGHQAGDLLLQEMGRRLTSCVGDNDSVARLGGDEFVVLLPDLDDNVHIEAVAQRILVAAGNSFTALAQEFHVTASIGISTFPKDGDDERSLMKHADIAMYQAKEDGRNNFKFYSEQLNVNSFERLALESSLRRALERGEFELHYQPKIGLQHGRIVGMEALLRWNHPELGTVPPAKFIPVAEETGLIVSIGKWVLKTACLQNVAWQRQGLPSLTMAVNLSGRQFMDEALLRSVTAILRETGMDAGLLELEITETVLMHDVDKAMRILQALRDMGVRLAVDDFGTGYSSLSNLRQFPIDTIKVDRSFIRELPTNAANRGITEAIIAMGRTLSLTVIAEGVETREQAEFLRTSACDEFQGFYFSKAVPAVQFAELLRTQPAATAPGAEYAV